MRLFLEEQRIVDAFDEEDGEHNHEDELDELEQLLQHHDGEAVLLVVLVHLGEEGVQVVDVAPLGLARLRHNLDHHPGVVAIWRVRLHILHKVIQEISYKFSVTAETHFETLAHLPKFLR